MAGIGIDLTPVARMEATLSHQQFMDNTFSMHEQEYCRSYADAAVHFAGTFAAKEAVRKATGIYSAFNEIEIRRTGEGKPIVWMDGAEDTSISISISHTDTLAVAVAVIEKSTHE